MVGSDKRKLKSRARYFPIFGHSQLGPYGISRGMRPHHERLPRSGAGLKFTFPHTQACQPRWQGRSEVGDDEAHFD